MDFNSVSSVKADETMSREHSGEHHDLICDDHQKSAEEYPASHIEIRLDVVHFFSKKN